MGTQKNHLIEIILLSIQNMFKMMDKTYVSDCFLSRNQLIISVLCQLKEKSHYMFRQLFEYPQHVIQLK